MLVKGSEATVVQELVSVVETLVSQGGPSPTDDDPFGAVLERVWRSVTEGSLSERELSPVHAAFGDALAGDTLQGFGFRKPHGYAGDFEMIDLIYREHVAKHPSLAGWDHFFQRQAAPRAVRNRRRYFAALLDRLAGTGRPFRVLKLGSGPGRTMFEWLRANPDVPVHFECVEIDAKAIAFARALNADHLDRIEFHHQNALRFRPRHRFDLIWSAGLFDYFEDRVFESLVRRLLPAVAPGGEIVIGNFAKGNPSRAYMELVGQWFLHHRTEEELRDLLVRSGARREGVSIGREAEGVNLFVHYRG